MTTGTKDDVVKATVMETLAEQAKVKEEERLESEMEALEASMSSDSMPDLADSDLERIKALLEEFREVDSQRHKNKVKTEIAREAGAVEEAKNLVAARPALMKHLNIIVKKMVACLAAAEDVRGEMVNWLTMPYNLRHLLAARLLEHKPSIDVSDLVERAEAIEEERRKLRRLTQSQG